MSFHSAPRHLQLAGYFRVVAPLQKQFDDLLFAWTEPNSLLLHLILPLVKIASPHWAHGLKCDSKLRSIHVAILCWRGRFYPETHFPQTLADGISDFAFL
jgi:hypothetical protein